MSKTCIPVGKSGRYVEETREMKLKREHKFQNAIRNVKPVMQTMPTGSKFDKAKKHKRSQDEDQDISLKYLQKQEKLLVQRKRCWNE